MPYGIIHTYGKNAFTIETNDKKQYYASYYLNMDFLENIIDIYLDNLPVKFDIDYNRYSGESNGSKRYYAINLTIELVI